MDLDRSMWIGFIEIAVLEEELAIPDIAISVVNLLTSGNILDRNHVQLILFKKQPRLPNSIRAK